MLEENRRKSVPDFTSDVLVYCVSKCYENKSHNYDYYYFYWYIVGWNVISCTFFFKVTKICAIDVIYIIIIIRRGKIHLCSLEISLPLYCLIPNVNLVTVTADQWAMEGNKECVI